MSVQTLEISALGLTRGVRPPRPGVKTLVEVPYATFESEGRRVFAGMRTGVCLLMEKELLPPAA
jgi:hypothetical protein